MTLQPIETSRRYQVNCQQRYKTYVDLAAHLEKLGLHDEAFRALHRAKFWQLALRLPQYTVEYNLIDALLAKLATRTDYRSTLELTDYLQKKLLGHCGPDVT